MIHYIYTIVNRVNGKTYVGYTNRKNPRWRWDAHLRDVKNTERPLYQSMRKHGVDNFSFDVIYCSQDGKHTLEIMENFFIKEYCSHISEGKGYNISWGGQANTGWVPSTETRELWSIQRTGKKMSVETVQKRSESMKQRYLNHPELRKHLQQIAIERGTQPPEPTPETWRKSGDARRGKSYHTLERKRKLSEDINDPNHPFNRDGVVEKRKQTWKEISRGCGEKNGNAVFCDVYDPSGRLVGSGFLRSVCDTHSLPFDKFLAASRHGNPLQRGKWKGWVIKRKSPHHHKEGQCGETESV